MSIIQIKDLNFRYDSRSEYIFKNSNFNIDTEWKVGLIGRNGKGKTTFLKLLMNEYQYRGKIVKNVNFDYFPFEVKNEDKTTIEVIADFIPKIEEWKIVKELNLLNSSSDILNRSFKTLSGGEKVKILLIILFLKENNFLLIDEPTNHLDNETIDEVSKYLILKTGFILVSHNRELIDKTVDHVIVINNTNIEIQKGNFTSWKENKDKQDNFELNQNKKLKKDIQRLDIAAKNTAKWSEAVESTKYSTKNSGLKPDKGYIGHKSAKMMKRSKSIINRKQEAIDEKEKLLKNIDRSDSLTMKPLIHEKNIIVCARNLQIKYNEKSIFEKLNFEIKNGDRLAIIGKNGSGKSSIIKLIMGDKIDYEGTINIANNIKISYISQHTDYLKNNLKNFAEENKIDEGIFKSMLIKLGFSKNDLDKNMSDFSEGQKKKVLIAKSITESAHIYVWDEPLNFIDIISRMQIEEVILKYMPTMIFVSHDKIFTKNIATKIINI